MIVIASYRHQTRSNDEIAERRNDELKLLSPNPGRQHRVHVILFATVVTAVVTGTEGSEPWPGAFPVGERAGLDGTVSIEDAEGELSLFMLMVLLDWAGTAVAACTIFKLLPSYSILPPQLLRIQASSGVTMRLIGPGQLSICFFEICPVCPFACLPVVHCAVCPPFISLRQLETAMICSEKSTVGGDSQKY